MPFEKGHEKWMLRALELAQQAEAHGEVPVGAILVRDGQIVGEGYNQPISSKDPTAHAEIVALRSAANKLDNYRLPDCTLYVTVEPCAMCAGAIIHSRLKQVVFGTPEPRAGAVISQLNLLSATHTNHQVPFVEGVMAESCSEIISSFFRQKRQKKMESE